VSKWATKRRKSPAAQQQLFSLARLSHRRSRRGLKLSDTPKGSLYYCFPDGKDQLAIETLQKGLSIGAEDVCSARAPIR
jgi:hypothetical protein